MGTAGKILLVVALAPLVIIGVYELTTGRPAFGGVDFLMREVGNEKLNQIRMDPAGTFVNAKDQNLPAFLAFLDMDIAVTDNAVDEYRNLMKRVEDYYKDTPKDIVHAVFTIYNAKTYYTDLTYLRCLQYLCDTITEDAQPARKNVRQMGDEIQTILISKYFEPQMLAIQEQQAAEAQYQQQLQKSINENLAAARARGAARDASETHTVVSATSDAAWVQQQMNWAWNDYSTRGGSRR